MGSVFTRQHAVVRQSGIKRQFEVTASGGHNAGTVNIWAGNGWDAIRKYLDSNPYGDGQCVRVSARLVG